MGKLTKKQKVARTQVDRSKLYSLTEAAALVKEITNVNFDASVDIAVRLGVDPRKANQMVRWVVTLPHGTGKDVRVLAIVTPDKEDEAKAANYQGSTYLLPMAVDVRASKDATELAALADGYAEVHGPDD